LTSLDFGAADAWFAGGSMRFSVWLTHGLRLAPK
jgi:hypothetical protein